MAVFRYKARTTSGQIVSGLVEAADGNTATRLLHEKQLFVITLTPGKSQFDFSQVATRFQKVKFTDIVNFTRQLSTMVVAGLSLPEALSILRSQTPNPAFAQVLSSVEHAIVGGGNLADALGSYSNYFPPIYVALVRAG